jgi:ubiquinone/menaquinone biosynthesis C-methylase UbiE
MHSGSRSPIRWWSISHPLVEIASRRAADAGIGNADFVFADAQTYDFTDGEFTLNVSQFGSMFFDDSEEAFANLRRSLAPGGRLSLEFLLGMAGWLVSARN